MIYQFSSHEFMATYCLAVVVLNNSIIRQDIWANDDLEMPIYHDIVPILNQ